MCSSDLQDDGVDDAEDRGIRANAQRERQDAGQRERRRFAKLPEREANVGEHVLDGEEAPYLAPFLFHARDVAEGAPGGQSGILPGNPARHERIGLLVQVLSYLFGEILFEPTPLNEIPHPADHGFTGDRTSLMPSSIRSKLDTSRWRCATPAGVIS